MNPKKIKILELRTVSGTGGGPEKTIFLTAQKINPDSFETHIIYTRNKDDPQYNWMRKYWQLPERVLYHDYVEKFSFAPSILGFFKNYCQQHQIDILHSHEYKTDVLCRLIQKKFPIKWVSTFHAPALSSQKLRFYQWLAYRALRKADLVFMVAPHQEALLLKKGVLQKNLILLANGVDTEIFRSGVSGKNLKEKWGLPKEAVVIGFLGRLSQEKNLPLMLKVFSQVSNRFDQAYLMLGGEGPERGRIEKLIEELNLKNKCRLVGFQEDPVAFYSSIDIYVQTSSTEQMPNTVLEAMAMELPVVATRVGGIGELITAGVEGYLVESRDSGALTQFMLKLIEDSRLRKQIGARGREKVARQYSFDARVRKLEEHYERLCQK